MDISINLFQTLVSQSISVFSIPEKPATLYDPIRYFLSLPGKRLRPLLVLSSLALYRQPTEQDSHAALATELFHNFSLVHDDIMDKADLRRGFETMHKKWNESTALLAGDALLILAYEALLVSRTTELPLLIQSFNEMSKAVCEGQQLDMDFSALDRVSINAYMDMIDRKTGALIAFSFEMGGFLGQANEQDRKALHDFGAAMGRCFQLRDDYLDLFGDPEKTGKVRGGDIGNCKLTFPILKSLSASDNHEFHRIWTSRPAEDPDRIRQALYWMEKQRIPEELEQKIDAEMEVGMKKLAAVQGIPEAKDQIGLLCKSLAYREK